VPWQTAAQRDTKPSRGGIGARPDQGQGSHSHEWRANQVGEGSDPPKAGGQMQAKFSGVVEQLI